MELPSPTGSCAIAGDSVLVGDAVGPSWIAWESDCLNDARVVYVDRSDWDIWVMDEAGNRRRCLTCFDNNALGVNFPLDEDGVAPEIHWKGDPEAHPTEPILIFKAENEHSAHLALHNAPGIGWDNDLWALNVCTRRYTRLTRLTADEGLQHTAISEDGRWFVYPRRYGAGQPLVHFGAAALVFGAITVDGEGALRLEPRFEAAPLGALYYEPNDILRTGDGQYALFYVAGDTTMLDPYRFDWCDADTCERSNLSLAQTDDVHEEFTMVSPGASRLVWMRGPLMGAGYHADLFLSALDFSEGARLTWFNDCERNPDGCKPNGAQLSRLTWNGAGDAVYFGLWNHGAFGPFESVELHRLDFAGLCGS